MTAGINTYYENTTSKVRFFRTIARIRQMLILVICPDRPSDHFCQICISVNCLLRLSAEMSHVYKSFIYHFLLPSVRFDQVMTLATCPFRKRDVSVKQPFRVCFFFDKVPIWVIKYDSCLIKSYDRTILCYFK